MDEATVRRFLGQLIDPPVGCAELRIFDADIGRNGYIIKESRYKKTIAAYTDSVAVATVLARSLHGVSGYATINPVRRDLMARDNSDRLAKVDRGGATKDGDIVCLRNIFVDVDPIRPSGISATDEEHWQALAVRDRILSEHPEIRASAIWGSSGNGAWILIRLPDLTNDGPGNALVARTLAALAKGYDSARVEIDQATKNASRVIGIAGLPKCKGANRRDRPWRRATMDSPTDHDRTPLNVATWLANHEPREAAQPAKSPGGRGGKGKASRSKVAGRTPKERAKDFGNAMAPAVSGAHGHDQLFDVACRFRNDFGLDRADMLELLGEWNQSHAVPPESDYQVQHKVDDAIKKYPTPSLAKLNEASKRGERAPAAPADSSPEGAAQEGGVGASADATVGADIPADVESLTDTGNSLRLARDHEGIICYCPQRGCWYVWDGVRWREDNSGAVFRLARKTIGLIRAEAATVDKTRAKALLKWADASESRRSMDAMIYLARFVEGVAVEPSDLDRDPWLLNCPNGTVDLRTGELREHRPSDLLTMLAPVEFDPIAKCERWDRFVAEIMDGDADMVGYLDRIAGYAMTGHINEHELYFFHGAGRNGKSQWLGIIRGILGDYAATVNASLITSKAQEDHPTGLTDLDGKRFVSTIEVEDGKRLAEALVKTLTGGDRIRARRMRQDFYEFSPTHKLIMAANHEPAIKGRDRAIWDRIRLIPFPMTFVDAEEFRANEDLPADQRRKLGVKDKKLEEALSAESKGILARMVRGCLAWRRDGMQPPAKVNEATDAYRERQDDLAPYIEDCCTVHPLLQAETNFLYASYLSWHRGGDPLSTGPAHTNMLIR